MAQKTLENELKELENIVARLSSEELPLEEAIALYTKGLELSRNCDALLAAARQTVETGKMQLEDEINDLE